MAEHRVDPPEATPGEHGCVGLAGGRAGLGGARSGRRRESRQQEHTCPHGCRHVGRRSCVTSSIIRFTILPYASFGSLAPKNSCPSTSATCPTLSVAHALERHNV